MVAFFDGGKCSLEVLNPRTLVRLKKNQKENQNNSLAHRLDICMVNYIFLLGLTQFLLKYVQPIHNCSSLIALKSPFVLWKQKLVHISSFRLTAKMILVATAIRKML